MRSIAWRSFFGVTTYLFDKSKGESYYGGHEKIPVPKDNPAPLSAISYGDSVTVGELVYSLDKFRPRFPLRWQAIRLKQGDEFLPLTDDNMQKAVFDSIIYPLYPLVDYVPTGGPGKFGGNLYWWSFAGVLITLHKFKPFNSKGLQLLPAVGVQPQ